MKELDYLNLSTRNYSLWSIKSSVRNAFSIRSKTALKSVGFSWRINTSIQYCVFFICTTTVCGYEALRITCSKLSNTEK
jgi:hypothetical protein